MATRFEIQELADNSTEWFTLENATPDGSRKITELLQIMYQWKEKRPENDYRIAAIIEIVLAETED